MKRFLLGLLLAFSVVTLSAKELNVASFNIRLNTKVDYKTDNGWEQRRDVLCEMINFEAFDIFGVQEAKPEQLRDMLERMPDYAYIGVGRDDGQTKGEHSAIFYRKSDFKVLENGTFWLSETPNEVSFGWGAKHRRICSWGLFVDKKSKTKFYFLNLHLDHRVKAAQNNGSKLVIDFVRTKCKKSANVIMTGDFNVTQTSEAYGYFANSGILQDSYHLAKYRFAPTGTFNGFNPQRYTTQRIDHIFVSKGVKVSRYGVLTYHYFLNKSGEEKSMDTLAPASVKGEDRESKCISDHYAIQAFITLK